jgi:hypothetical protein
VKKVSEVTGKKGRSIWSSDIRLDCEQLFADHFEPEAIYVIKLANDFPEGSLMLTSSEKLEGFGIDLTNAKLLMEVKGPFDMEEFVTKVVEPEVNPTVLLLEWQPGFVIGGFAGIPWPKVEGRLGWGEAFAADAERRSFIFSLEPNARRFDLLTPDRALLRAGGPGHRVIYFGVDLAVVDGGTCWGQSNYDAGGRGIGSFPDGAWVHFTRFELWAL